MSLQADFEEETLEEMEPRPVDKLFANMSSAVHYARGRGRRRRALNQDPKRQPPTVHTVILSFSSVNMIDSSGLSTLRKLFNDLKSGAFDEPEGQPKKSKDANVHPACVGISVVRSQPVTGIRLRISIVTEGFCWSRRRWWDARARSGTRCTRRAWC